MSSPSLSTVEHNTPPYQPQPQQEQEQQPLPLGKLLMVFGALALSVFLSALDVTIVSTALPAIGREFKSQPQLPWVGVAFALTSTVVQPLSGSLSDIFGRKPTFLVSITLFLVGSALCGAAQTMTQLIFFRGLQGVGGGALMSLVFIIISELVSLRERGKFQGILGAVFGLASVIGPLLGGAFTDNISWRWAFYVNIPLGVIALIVVILVMHIPSPKGSMMDKLRKIDYPGVATVVTAVVCILLATNWGGNSFPWDSPVVITLYVVGTVFAVIFVLVELWAERSKRTMPVIPMRLFKNRNVVFSTIATFFNGVALYSVIFYGPTYFQEVKGNTATQSGLAMLPFMLGIVSFSITSGQAISKTGAYRLWIVAGFATATVGCGLLSTLQEDTAHALQVVYLLIAGVGIGMLNQTLVVTAQAAVFAKEVATVTALIQFTRTLGGTFGIAILGAVINGSAADERDPERLKQLYMTGIQKAFLTLIPFCACGFLSALFIQHIALKKYIVATHDVVDVSVPAAVAVPAPAPAPVPVPMTEVQINSQK